MSTAALFRHRVAWRSRLMFSPQMYRLWLSRSPKWDTGERLSVRFRDLKVTNDLRLVEFDGYQYYLPKSIAPERLFAVYKEIFYTNHPHYYEYRGCAIRSGDVVIDAGASEGFFTRFALSKGAKVIVVEPSEVWIDALQNTFADEIGEGRVIIKRACLGDHVGEVTVDVSTDLGWVNDYAESHRETVALTTIDDLITSSLRRCNFIKMDIEGSEFAAVAGAVQTLNGHKPRLSVAVYHQPTGFLDLRRDLQKLTKGYNITAKGLQPHFGFQIPVMLHAWPITTPQ